MAYTIMAERTAGSRLGSASGVAKCLGTVLGFRTFEQAEAHAEAANERYRKSGACVRYEARPVPDVSVPVFNDEERELDGRLFKKNLEGQWCYMMPLGNGLAGVHLMAYRVLADPDEGWIPHPDNDPDADTEAFIEAMHKLDPGPWATLEWPDGHYIVGGVPAQE